MLFAGWGAPLRAVPAPPLDRLQELRIQDLRVASVAYRLALANRAICRDAITPQLGFTMHGIEQYEDGDRQGVAAAFALGGHAGVMAVVDGSPADRAGLEADDQLLSVNGKALTSDAAPNATPTRAFVERAQTTILEEMKAGEVTLRVSGARGLRDVRFVPELGCSSNVELVPGKDVNAWADGARVVVSAGILARCASDDDLALVIAHELAHNLLHHGRRLAEAGGSAARVLGILGGGSAMMRETEEEADRLAVTMAIAADYDLSQAAAFMSGLLNDPDVAPVSGTHPAPDRRLTLLRAEIAASRRKA